MNHDDFHSDDSGDNPPHGELGHQCSPSWMDGPRLTFHPDEYALSATVMEYADGTSEDGIAMAFLDNEVPTADLPIPGVMLMNNADAARLAVTISVSLGMETIEQAFIELRQLRSQAEGKTPESAEVIRAEMVEHIRQVAADAERDRQDTSGFDFGEFGL